MTRTRALVCVWIAVSVVLAGAHVAEVSGQNASSDSLEAGFRNPPASAKPRAWWHWMDGNVTQEGIRADLEWMHRIGMGGVHNFDAALATPRRVNPRVAFLTPEWRQSFRLAAETVDRLGFELSIAGSPGWSESGGPWVKPQEAMKKLVWSETRVAGGKRFSGKLAPPPTTVGPFQNASIDGSELIASEGPKPVRPELYADVAVIAYRLPDDEQSPASQEPVVSASHGAPLEGAILWDGDVANTLDIPFAPADGAAWLQVTFDEPRTVRAMSLALPSAGAHMFFVDPTKTVAELHASTDGSDFSRVVEIKQHSAVQRTISFEPITARYFRLLLPRPPVLRLPFLSGINLPTAGEHRVAELELHSSARVHRAEDKAAFFVASDLDGEATPAAPASALVNQDHIVDLTTRLRPDGTLAWTPPRGRWAVLRFGYSLTGVLNHPASPEGTGLEVDKLSREHVRSYVTQYLDRYAAFLAPELMGRRGLQGMISDSWEAGAQNWTERLPEQFAKRRGYELWPWLPALTGRVIESAEATDRFLWDYRRTLAEMLSQNHYGVIADELHRRGMIHYAESHEARRAFIGDGMDAKRFSDVPMSATWVGGSGSTPDQYDADVRESASVAHIYGQNIVAAESLTAAGNTFAFVPEMLKPTADRMLANGLNRFVIHTSVHQPLDEPGPGFTLGPFGQWFTRHETWAEQAQPWIDYLARSSYLLQQGTFVADVLYFYGEDSNITALYMDGLPAIPQGYNYDFASAHALGLLEVSSGDLVTEHGMRYRLLALDPRTKLMSLDVLKRIRELVNAGATVVGLKPHASPSLADDQHEFRAIADSLWGSASEVGERAVGAGRVMSGLSLDEALAKLRVAPDFSYTKPAADSKILFVHRRLNDGDLYFINNRQARAESIEASFRIAGKVPEVWRADTGSIEPVSYRIAEERTIVPLRLDASDAVFVVFRKAAAQDELRLPAPRRTLLETVKGPWQVSFASGQGAPDATTFDQLLSWTQSTQPGIKYYSGTATYARELKVPAAWLRKSQRVEVDLGAVKNLAEVIVNGRSLAVLWKAPFRVDITEALRRGDNSLEVRVTNPWVNRLIGDKQPGAKPYAYSTFDPYTADSPLLDSGLLGPVTVLAKVSAGSSQ